MNTENQKFIEDFKLRTSGFQKFNLRVTDLHKRRMDINNSLTALCNFLNNKVMAKATSSLIKTQVELPYKENHWNSKDYIRKITFNHKGFGTIREPKDSNRGYTPSTSQKLDETEIIEIITDVTLRDAIKADLLQQNCYKCLRHFNDVCSAESELLALRVLSDKYKTAIKENFAEPQTIIETTVGSENYETRDKEGEHKIILKPFVMKTIRISNGDRITLDTNDNDNTDDDKDGETYLTLSFSDIETSMVLMQIPDELDKVLTKVEEYIGVDHNEVMKLDGLVKDKLAVYALMDAIND